MVARTQQHEHLFAIDAGQDEDANTWRFIEIRLVQSGPFPFMMLKCETIGRTKEIFVYSFLGNSGQKEAVVNLLTSMVAPLDGI